MSRVLYTSDLHLRHGLVSGLRGFGSIEDHDEFVLDTWSQHVRPQDTVYVLGDLTGRSNREQEDWALKQLGRLPGRKHLIAGNHDSVHPMHSSSRDRSNLLRWLVVFESVQTLAVRKMRKRRLMLSHFPYDAPGGDHTETNRHLEWRPVDTGRWLIHGHTHLDTQRLHDRQIHVGLDAWRRPVDESEVFGLIEQAESEQSEVVS